jgi:hypothetical protein
MSDTLIDTLNNKEYAELKDNLNKVIDKKIQNIIQLKKDEVVAAINGQELNQDTDTTVADNTEGNTEITN